MRDSGHALDRVGARQRQLDALPVGRLQHDLSLPYDPATRRLFGVPVVATVNEAAGVRHVLATSSGQPVQHEHGAAPPRRATRSQPVPPLRLITTIAAYEEGIAAAGMVSRPAWDRQLVVGRVAMDRAAC